MGIGFFEHNDFSRFKRGDRLISRFISDKWKHKREHRREILEQLLDRGVIIIACDREDMPIIPEDWDKKGTLKP